MPSAAHALLVNLNVAAATLYVVHLVLDWLLRSSPFGLVVSGAAALGLPHHIPILHHPVSLPILTVASRHWFRIAIKVPSMLKRSTGRVALLHCWILVKILKATG